ncbi:PH domain-like protein [Macroventuria anomochaeta]|uniref:PH domain-like protein n=1 Tax=Macroventuria anomochaeta TaxID=301207 RepID=A0ACB6SHW9_9PLEO|nr:PH domain-like protein [Macroventuria anomochaeta]KAF2633087.1 PH domain-like protein [Macroventuria anomochaeta]
MAEGAQQTLAKPVPVTRSPAAMAGMKLSTPAQPRLSSIQAQAQAHSAGVMSPVSQNGCFEFDRIIKAGSVLKRTRKTKQWKPIYIVLRPNRLSMYKDEAETKLRHQINLSEITAVARQKDSKKKTDHVFGIFSPARNYHLGAPTDREAQAWVDLIRAEARIDEEEGELILLSPTGTKTGTRTGTRTGTQTSSTTAVDRSHRAHSNTLSSSSDPEPSSLPPGALPPSALPRDSQSIAMHSARRPSQALNYSGNEHGSVSDFDFSDSAAPNARSSTSLPYSKSDTRNPLPRNRNVSQISSLNVPPSTSDSDPDRVVYHGWLYVLKSKGGVRQWRKVWVVLRPKCLGFYKNAEEYSANLIIPFASIIDAVDIDSVSRSKQYCMQVISEEKNFRFCAKSENELAKWLGAFKSLLVRRREGEGKRAAQAQVQTPALTTTAATPTVPQAPTPQQKRVSTAELNVTVPTMQPMAIK